MSSVPEPLDRILPPLLADLRASLGNDLVGAYLYGSAISGGFDPALSDLDLVVVTAQPTDELAFAVFDGVVQRLMAREPDWADRLDIVFVGRSTLAGFRAGGRFLDISHDEPLRVIEDAADWLETWYLARDADTALVGPSARSIIPEIELDEFLGAVRGNIADRVEMAARTSDPGRSPTLSSRCAAHCARSRRTPPARRSRVPRGRPIGSRSGHG